jgi:hypothetical protein
MKPGDMILALLEKQELVADAFFNKNTASMLLNDGLLVLVRVSGTFAFVRDKTSNIL